MSVWKHWVRFSSPLPISICVTFTSFLDLNTTSPLCLISAFADERRSLYIPTIKTKTETNSNSSSAVKRNGGTVAKEGDDTDESSDAETTATNSSSSSRNVNLGTQKICDSKLVSGQVRGGMQKEIRLKKRKGNRQPMYTETKRYRQRGTVNTETERKRCIQRL